MCFTVEVSHSSSLILAKFLHPFQAQGSVGPKCTELCRTFHWSDHKWELIHWSPPAWLHFSFSWANQQLFVQCHLTRDFSEEERKAAWALSEAKRADVTASERRGGWRREEVKENWECVRGNKSESITRKYPAHIIFPLFILHSSTRMDKRLLLCFYLQAIGAALCCHRSL